MTSLGSKARISAHLWLHEFAQPARHGFEAEPYPEDWVDDRLIPLCAAIEMVRAKWNRKVTIVSGYRSPEYNSWLVKHRGASPRSKHMEGIAADIQIEGVPSWKVFQAAKKLRADYKAGRSAVWLGGIGLYPTFVHLDLRERAATWRPRG